MLRFDKSELKPKRATLGRAFQNNWEHNAAIHSIDRDLSTAAVTHTDDGAGWLKLEFDRSYQIHKVVIYYRFFNDWFDSGACTDTSQSFKACLDNDNDVDVTVYQRELKQESCGTLLLTYGLEQKDQIYTLICNTEGDTVKLSKDTGIIGVFEITVMGTLASGTFKHLFQIVRTLFL